MNELDAFTNKLFLFISKAMVQELRRQGHVLTGKLIESFDYEVRQQVDTIAIDFLMLKYGRSLNDGIPPERIPYSPDGRRGGKSKYIQGLIQFALLKFTADKKEATSIAFAIARKHKKEGYPLTKKLRFIDISLEAKDKEIQDIIADYIELTIEKIINQYLTFINGNI